MHIVVYLSIESCCCCLTMAMYYSQVWADDGGWSNTSHRKHFRNLLIATAVCGRALSWRRTIPEDNILRHLFWIKESYYSTYSTFGRRDIVLGMFTGSLRTQNWHMRCEEIDGHTRDIAQCICAELRLILTVVLILQLIVPLKKKNSPPTLTRPNLTHLHNQIIYL